MEKQSAEKLELQGVNVTLNKPDIAELDRLAREGQSSRSQLVRTAIQDFLHSDRPEKIAAKGRRFRPAR